jgi:hypothetical protein
MRPPKTALQIHFGYDLPKSEYDALCEQAAPAIANVDGLVWKIFLIDENHRTAGGQYLFASRETAEAYLRGPIVAGLRAHPAIRSVTTALFDIQESPSAKTRAPMGLA